MYMQYFKYFEEVAKENSFTKAAKNLYISQQSLSEHIKRLEEHYGILLFTRKPTLHLTHAGELLLEHIGQAQRLEEQLLAEFSYISSKQKGKIRVGITPTRAPIFFPHIFARFNSKYPLVELSIREDHTSYLMKDLLEGKIDFIIGLADTKVGQGNMIASTTLLHDRKLYFLVSKKLLTRHGFPDERISSALETGVNLKEIQNIPIILKPGTSKIHSQIAQEYQKLSTKPKIVIESSNVYPLLPLYSAGNAGGFISQTILQYISEHYSNVRDSVLALPMNDIHINCDIAIMHFKDRPISAHFSEFIEITKSVFAEYVTNV